MERGNEESSKLREEKVACLPKIATWHLLDSGVGDGRWLRGRGDKGSPGGALVAASQPRRLGGKLPAGYSGLLLLGHYGGGNTQ